MPAKEQIPHDKTVRNDKFLEFLNNLLVQSALCCAMPPAMGSGDALTEFRSIRSEDLPEVSRFLIRIYRVERTAPFADPRFLAWKYLTPRSEWNGSRGYVVEYQRKIVAHAGVSPGVLRLPGGSEVSCITIMDWAADPSVRGVGVSLFKELMKLAETVYIIGGTPATRHILPKIGFERAGEACTFSRWIRPVREFRTRPLSGRSVLRLLHGISRFRKTQPGNRRMNSRSVPSFDESLQLLLNQRSSDFAYRQRTVENLNYLLACPARGVKGHLLLEQDTVCGYFIMATVDWETRLLDIFVNSADVLDWQLAYSAAAAAAEADPSSCRIRTLATTPMHREALVGAGYWEQYKEPIMIHDPNNRLTTSQPVNFQLCDEDGGY